MDEVRAGQKSSSEVGTAQWILRHLPPEWHASQPIVFKGLRQGQFIARVSGPYQIPHAVLLARHWEVEGYGSTDVEALQDLARKLRKDPALHG